ncbi:MAG: hypothetical protein AAEJ04_02010 [Planctomycetota bacterium]
MLSPEFTTVRSIRGSFQHRSLFTGWVLCLLALLFIATPVESVMAQDDPGIARLELKFERPRQVTVFGGNGNDLRPDGVPTAGRTYWYLPYTLENKSGMDGTFHVGLRATSDKKRKYCDIALPWVEEVVERREGKEFFSRADLIKKNGVADFGQAIAAGEKRECVAIFNAIDPEADNIVVDVHGLIDDMEVEELANGGLKITERVVRIQFHRPGDEFFSSMDSFRFEKKSWVRLTHEFPGS